ncbi:MAG: response regulator transcription factor [Myxococcota bacterium]
MAGESKAAILVVEDEEGIRIGICDVLAYKGYRPVGVESGEEGLEKALSGEFDLILLDIMLPGIDGFEVCRRVREQAPDQAVLMLTAKGAEEDVLEGFSSGADDYVTKPFSVRELMARVEAVLRRAGSKSENCTVGSRAFEFADWQIDPELRQGQRGDETVELSRREIDMLALFARERGRIVSRRTLLHEVWGMRNAENINTRTVDMHIAKLRKKIDRLKRSLIETVRGEGYRFLP